MAAAALVQLPAAWVLTAIVVAAFGLAPRFVVAGWVALAGFVVLGELGPLDRPQPVGHGPLALRPRAQAARRGVQPAAARRPDGVAALLAAVGLAGLRRRDVGR